jgi:hypothetical protein
MGPVLAGLAIGLVAAFYATRVVATFLFEDHSPRPCHIRRGRGADYRWCWTGGMAAAKARSHGGPLAGVARRLGDPHGTFLYPAT